MTTTHTGMPKSFAAGTSVEYTRSVSNYPASDGWTLKLYLRGKASVTVTATINANGKDYDIAIPPSGSGGSDVMNADTYEGLLYQYEERVEKVGPSVKSVCVGRGQVWVTLNLATAGAGVAQLQEEKELAIVNAAIEGRLTKDMESYQFEGRAVVRIPIPELMNIRRDLVRAIRSKRNRGQISTPVKMAFRQPGCR